MADRPILFSAPMVRALIDGRKTQTRRIIKPQPYSPESVVSYDARSGTWMSVEPSPTTGGTRQMDPWRTIRIKIGDRLYVREAWRTLQGWDCIAPRQLAEDRSKITYEADPNNRNPLWVFGKFRQAMHMPRWASRITLIVEGVKVERLQDISEEDALAEGVPNDWNYTGSGDETYCSHCRGFGVHAALGAGYGVTEVDCAECETLKLRYRNLWNHINGPDAWADNPWVVAYTFRVIKGNINQIDARANANAR